LHPEIWLQSGLILVLCKEYLPVIYHIKSRDTVGCHHYQQIIIDVIYITNFTMIYTLLSREIEICSN
jgi:hypothetical protein